MANVIPFQEGVPAGGGYLLPPEQGEILINAILQESGAIQLCGDVRATQSIKTQFPVWLGQPTAGPVGEGATKPVTGAAFGQAVLNVKKFASMVMFTDEMIEDVQSGDLNVLVDSGVRQAINHAIDAHAVGMAAGAAITSVFDSTLAATTQVVEYDQTKADGLERAISAAMGALEHNGYGDQANMAVLLGFGFAQTIRDARASFDTTMRVYTGGRDPLYGLPSYISTNLNFVTDAPAASDILGFVVHRPNLHCRLRKDVTLSVSSEATVNDGTTDRHLFQEDLTAVRYETRLAFMIHDEARAVVAITNKT